MALSSSIRVGIDILSSALSITKAIVVQLGDAIASVVEGQGAEWWQQIGFASLPAEQVKGQQGAQALAIPMGDRFVVFASRDLRGAYLAGQLKPGEACVYAPGSQARSLYKVDGSSTHYTTDDTTPTGKTISQQMRPDGFTWIAPWGTLSWDAKGLRIKDASGAMLLLGPPASPPPGLLSNVKSCARLIADATEVLGNATCKIGIKGGVCAPIAVIPTGTPVVGTTGTANPSNGVMCSQ